MSDPLIRSCSHYVVLEPGKEEQLLNENETLAWLEDWLNKLHQLPIDLKNQSSNYSAARRLLDTACNLEIKPGFTIQWFAIRLDSPFE